MRETIVVPQNIERDSLSNFFIALDALKNSPSVAVDFSSIHWSTPTGMLVAGSKLREWVSYRHKNKLESIPVGISVRNSSHTYLMHFGFFKYILMDQGNDVGQATGSRSYLPITRVEKPKFSPFEQSLSEWYELIQYESNRLAKVLCENSVNNEMYTAYSYAIREILRNVFEHSMSNECYICGQRWRGGKVEIAIVDEGIGISKSLQASYPDAANGENALKMSIRPGITRISGIPEAQNFYENTGFGLYILCQLGSRFGWFLLGSGSGRINCENENISFSILNFNGTFLGLKIYKPLNNFSEVLTSIIHEGEKISGTKGISSRASGGSKSLTS